MPQIRLSQSLASIKLTLGRTNAENADLHQRLQKHALLNGKKRVYTKLNDNGIELMPEVEQVQLLADKALEKIVANYTELSDINATRDYGNAVAKANVVIDGKVFMKDAPPTFLMFLLHQLEHLRVIIDKTVVLDQSHQWTWDKDAGLFHSEPSQTFKTEKIQSALVLVAPTDKHPGQAQVVVKDVNIGSWATVHFSGAITYTRRINLLTRIDKMQKAVEEALNECNSTKVDKQEISAALFSYVFTE